MCDEKLVDKENGTLRPMLEGDLERILEWRNNKNIRRYMYNKNLIGIEEHKAWYLEKSKQEGQHLLIFELEGVPLGFVSFSVREGHLADWGFYTSPEAPKGTGYKLGKIALNYAFEDLQMHKISGEVLDFNKKSIEFHLRMGFTQEGILREHFFDGVSYHSVIYFGLLSMDREGNK